MHQNMFSHQSPVQILESLISMYKSLTKGDVGCDPLLYIIWALKQMTYECVAVEHLLTLLPQTISTFLDAL